MWAWSARSTLGAGSRSRSGPEGSSLKRSPAGAAGVPEKEPQAPAGGRARSVDEGCTVRLRAAPEDQPGAVRGDRAKAGGHAHRDGRVARGQDVGLFDLPAGAG